MVTQSWVISKQWKTLCPETHRRQVTKMLLHTGMCCLWHWKDHRFYICNAINECLRLKFCSYFELFNPREVALSCKPYFFYLFLFYILLLLTLWGPFCSLLKLIRIFTLSSEEAGLDLYWISIGNGSQVCVLDTITLFAVGNYAWVIWILKIWQEYTLIDYFLTLRGVQWILFQFKHSPFCL